MSAVFELRAVEAVTKAFNANLPKDGPLGTIRPSMAQLYVRPRRYYSPTAEPRVLPRPVERPTPRREIACDYYDPSGRDRPAVAPAGPWTMDEPCRRLSPGPIDPPWKRLPPVATELAAIVVKPVRRPVDLTPKGRLLDVYV